MKKVLAWMVLVIALTFFVSAQTSVNGSVIFNESGGVHTLIYPGGVYSSSGTDIFGIFNFNLSVDTVNSSQVLSSGQKLNRSGFFDIFDGGGNYEVAAVKNDRRTKLLMPEAEMYAPGERGFNFIGWVSK